MGNGTNGPVHQIVFDYCLNVFIVGNFTHAGGVKTGPLAVWRPFSTNWEPVGNFMNASFNGVINTVTSNCWDVRSSFVQCTCDLYIGGQFTLAIDENKTDIAVNVASYSFVSKQWSSMGGSASHGMSTRDSVVRSYSILLTSLEHYLPSRVGCASLRTIFMDWWRYTRWFNGI
jgi:hypothetical protein